MPALDLPAILVKRAAKDMSSTYVALAIVFGAIALIALLITFYMLARLRHNDQKLDRELAHTTQNNDFAPQFHEKEYYDDFPRPPVPPPSLPAEILQHGQGGFPGNGPLPPSPTPQRPVRRPSSLFDRKRSSLTPRMAAQSFEQQQQQSPVMVISDKDGSYMPPVWQAPPPRAPPQIDLHIIAPPEPSAQLDVLPGPYDQQQQMRPESSFSFYSSYAQTAGTEAPPLQVGRSTSFHRSPSLLRQLLHDRAAKNGIPLPPPAPQAQPPQRPKLDQLRPVTGLMPYDLETATPGPTPVDVPPSSAVSTATAVIDQRLYGYGDSSGTVMTMKSIPESAREDDPFTDAEETDPHSAARLTLLQPPISPPRRSPPALKLVIPNSHLKGMANSGAPPVPMPPMPELPTQKPKTKKKPVVKAPPPNPPQSYAYPSTDDDLSRGTVTPGLLQAFAARLRPETVELNAKPVLVHDDRTDEYRITMRP